MNNEKSARVWDAIEDTPEEAENMKLRSGLMITLKEHLGRSGLTQSQAAKLFGVTQPRVSDLLRGKINVFSLDALRRLRVATGACDISPCNINLIAAEYSFGVYSIQKPPFV